MQTILCLQGNVSALYKSDYKWIRRFKLRAPAKLSSTKQAAAKLQSVPQSLKETLNNKAVGLRFSGFSLPPGCLCNALPWLAVPASWGLEALIYTAEMETGFCAKHQGPPVTYLSVAFATYQEVLCLLSYPLPIITHGFMKFSFPLWHTVLHVPYEHPILSLSLSEDKHSDCTRNTDGANVKSVLWWQGK